MNTSLRLAANDNRRRRGGRLPVMVDLGVEVFAALTARLEQRGSVTAAEFSELVRRRCQERPALFRRREIADLLKIVDELSPLSHGAGNVIVLCGGRDEANI